MDVNTILTVFKAQEEELIRALREIETHIRKVPANKKVNISAKTTKARAELKKFEAELLAIRDNEEIDVKLRDRAAMLLADVAKVKATINSIPNDKVFTLRMRESIFGKLATAESRILRIGAAIQRLGGRDVEQNRIGDFFNTLSSRAKRAALQLRRLPAFISGIGIALVSALVPAVLAAVAAIGALVTAVTALATAFAAALGPIVGLAVAVFARFNKILEAHNSLQSAKNSAVRGSTAATSRATQADLAQADAAERVHDAQRAQLQASEELRDAQAGLAEAAKAAFEEMEQAARNARDAILEVRDAKIGLDEAKLGLRQAQLELKEFREGFGLAGDEFDSLFKKFTDVDFQFSRGALADALGGDVAKEDQLELESLILGVRRAKLSEVQANNRLKDSEEDVGDAREENARFQREGIAASDQYQQAVQRVADAQDNLVEATRDAKFAVEQTNAQLAAQEENLGAATGAMQLYNDQRDKLTKTEQRVLDLLNGVSSVAKKLSPATDAVFSGMLDALDRLKFGIPFVIATLNQLGKVVGDTFRDIANNLALNQSFNLARIFQGSIVVAKQLGRIVNGLLGTFLNIATGAMPLLEQAMKDIAASTEKWQVGTSNAAAITKFLTPMVETLRIVIDLIVQLGRGIINTFTAASGPINEFIGWIRDVAKNFADWAGSESGRKEIKEFFADTLPLAKAILQTIGKLVKVFLTLLRVFAPGLRLMLFFVDILLEFSADFNAVMAEIFQALFGVFQWIARVVAQSSQVQIMVQAFEDALAAVEDVWEFLKSLPGRIAKVFRNVAKSIGGGMSGTTGAITSPVKLGVALVTGYLKLAKKVWSTAISGIVTAISVAWHPIKAVLTWVIDRFRGLKNTIVTILENLVSGAEAAFTGFKAVVKTILNGVIRIANGFIRLWNGVFGKKREIDPPGPGKITLPSLKLTEITPLAKGGLVTGSTLALVGEGRSNEAVLPLTDRVFSKLGAAISGAMVPRLAPALAGGPRITGGRTTSSDSKTVIEKQEVHLPAPPSGGIMDPRYAAVQFARELKRRGL